MVILMVICLFSLIVVLLLKKDYVVRKNFPINNYTIALLKAVKDVRANVLTVEDASFFYRVQKDDIYKLTKKPKEYAKWQRDGNRKH